MKRWTEKKEIDQDFFHTVWVGHVLRVENRRNLGGREMLLTIAFS